MRDTSIEAYHEIVENGLLKRLQLSVYQCLFHHGPMTANEMRVSIDPSSNSGVYSTRLSELERKGVVKTVGKRPCRTTGKTAYVWDVTSKLPKDTPRDKLRDAHRRYLAKKQEFEKAKMVLQKLLKEHRERVGI